MNNELNKECDKKSWKAPELMVMSVSNYTENKSGIGGDGGKSVGGFHYSAS